MTEAALLPAIVVGLIGGTLVGLTGVGAGSVIAAGLLFAFPDIQPQVIVGSATLQAVGMKLVAVLGRRRFRFREGRLGLAMAAGAIPMAVAGAWVTSLIGGEVLKPIMALVLLVVGLVLVAQALLRAPVETSAAEGSAAAPDDRARARLHPESRRSSIGLVGAAVGFVTGLTSIGTGTLFVSALVGPLGLDSHRAVAVALLAGMLTLIMSGVTHAILGHADSTLIVGSWMGSLPGVLLGTVASRRLSSGALRGTIGAAIAVAAIVALARVGR